jgi:hypothetical protein
MLAELSFESRILPHNSVVPPFLKAVNDDFRRPPPSHVEARFTKDREKGLPLISLAHNL